MDDEVAVYVALRAGIPASTATHVAQPTIAQTETRIECTYRCVIGSWMLQSKRLRESDIRSGNRELAEKLASLTAYERGVFAQS